MVIVHPEYALLVLEINDLREEIADLIVEKDALAHYICKDVEIDYMLKIGALEYKRIVAENNYEKAIRKLEIIEEKISKKSSINIEAIDRKIRNEFKKQNKLESDMSSDIDFAIEMSSLEMFDFDVLEEMNIDYFKLQKLYNPIFDLEVSEEKAKMYKKIERYYEKYNYKKIHKLAENYNSEDVFQDEIENLKKLREKYVAILKLYRKEIRSIKNSFPYNQKPILEDENLCRRKKDNLNREIIEINSETKKIEKKINEKLKKSIK